MPTALITGASGFSSRHLVRRLRANHELRIVGTDIAPVPSVPTGIHAYHQADLRDEFAVSQLVEETKPDVVYHLAGQLRGSASNVFASNLQGGINLIEALVKHTPKAKMLAVGSAAEYGGAKGIGMPLTEEHPCAPSGSYALSKHAFTLAALDYARRGDLKITIVRPFNLLGAGIPPTLLVGAILARTKEALAASEAAEVAIGNLSTERDFLAVEDAVEAYSQLLNGEHWGEIFNICSGKPRSVLAVIEILLSFASRPVKLRVDPALIRANDVSVVYGSFAKARTAIGFEPSTPIESSLRAAWDDMMDGDIR